MGGTFTARASLFVPEFPETGEIGPQAVGTIALYAGL
jgi:hypothetical protein